MNRNTPMVDHNELLSDVIDRDPAYWDRPNVDDSKRIALAILQIIESLDDNMADAVENLVSYGMEHGPARFQRL